MTQRSSEQGGGDWQAYVQPYRYYGPGYRGVGYYAVFYQGPDEASDADQPESDEPQTQFDQRDVQYGQGQGSGWGWRDRRRFGRGGWNDRAGAWGDRARQFGQLGQHAGRGPKGYQRSDERIREDVSDRLTEHADLDASNIELQVKDGVVTLQGEVDSRWAKRMAEDIAEDVGGVRDVMNHLRVSSGFGGEMGQGGQTGTRGTSRTGTTSQSRGTTQTTASTNQPRNGRRSSTATTER